MATPTENEAGARSSGLSLHVSSSPPYSSSCSSSPVQWGEPALMVQQIYRDCASNIDVLFIGVLIISNAK